MKITLNTYQIADALKNDTCARWSYNGSLALAEYLEEENTPDYKLAAIELQSAFEKAGICAAIRGGFLEKDLDGWEHYSFNVLFKIGEKQASFDWKQGTGHVVKNKFSTRVTPKNPNPCEVLARICSESLDCKESFEEWSETFGYDADSRKAESIYNACKRNAQKLDLLGLDSQTIRNFSDLSNRL